MPHFRLLLPFLLAVTTAFAQTVRPTATVAGRAVVFGVSSADHQRFTIPQVRLNDAAAAARINRQLVALFAANLEALPSPLAAQQAVRQALAAYKDMDNQGYTAGAYEVLYNGHNLLSLEFSSEFMGAYPSSATSHVTFNLRTGRPVTVAQLLTDTLALRRRWRQAINREVAAAVHDLPTDFPELDSAGRADIAQRVGWNAARQQVDFEPGEPRFDDFALTATGLMLCHSFGFPHVILALEPNANCAFTYASLKAWLKPTGPLGFRK